MAIIKQSEYARHRGVSHASVQAAIKAGRITVHHTEKRGKKEYVFIDADVADQAWELNTNETQRRNATRGEMGREPLIRSVKSKAPWSGLSKIECEDRSFEGIGCILPAGACEKQFHEIMNAVCRLPKSEQRSAALEIIEIVCRSFGGCNRPIVNKKQLSAFGAAIKAIPEEFQTVAILEIVERLTGRLAVAIQAADTELNDRKEA
jgi:hypothetical protein